MSLGAQARRLGTQGLVLTYQFFSVLKNATTALDKFGKSIGLLISTWEPGDIVRNVIEDVVKIQDAGRDELIFS